VAFAVWLTGLSGSGKSAIARELLGMLQARGVRAAVLESDVLRTQLTPFPTYDDGERDFFYGALAALGAFVCGAGRAVLFDATANRRRYRDAARQAIVRFAEVHVDTPLEVCRARDPKGLYRDQKVRALPGVQAAYEPPLVPEVVVHGERGTPGAAAEKIVAFLGRRGWI
jgi:adenylylsulfate kinase